MPTCGELGGRKADGSPCGRSRSSTPCPGHEPQEEAPEERTVCGDFGGRTKAGTPCRRPRESTPCPGHGPEDDPAEEHTAAQSRMRAAQERFLQALPSVGLSGDTGEPCNVVAAARVAGIRRESHYRWLREDPTYPERYAEAAELARATLRAELHRRGFHGVEEVREKIITDQAGNAIRTERLTRRVRSDRIALRLAEAHLPEFRRKLDVRVLERELDGMSDEELLEEAERLLAKARGGAATPVEV